MTGGGGQRQSHSIRVCSTRGVGWITGRGRYRGVGWTTGLGSKRAAGVDGCPAGGREFAELAANAALWLSAARIALISDCTSLSPRVATIKSTPLATRNVHANCGRCRAKNQLRERKHLPILAKVFLPEPE